MKRIKVLLIIGLLLVMFSACNTDSVADETEQTNREQAIITLYSGGIVVMKYKAERVSVHSSSSVVYFTNYETGRCTRINGTYTIDCNY